MAKNVGRVPLFIEADTKEKLVMGMFENNVNQDKEFKYFDIRKEGSKWVAWYYATVEVKQ